MSNLAKNYQNFRSILKQKSGIEIGDSKITLLESRLTRRLAQVNAKNFDEYLKIINSNEVELKHFVEIMTTNKTDWFRESGHFEFLSKQVAELFNKRPSQPIMIWSAAASTGEEPYSLAIKCEEVVRLNGHYRILATDINTQVLEKGKNGIYGKDYIEQNLSERHVKSWFKPCSNDCYKVSSNLQEKIKFRQFNLLSSTLPIEIKFDFIFLRNVLIYFDAPTTKQVVERLSLYLNKGGYLIIGHSETLNGIKTNLTHLGKSIYKYDSK